MSISTECFYGGAVDAHRGYWIMEGYGYPHSLVRVDMDNHATDSFPLNCGYGITVDADGYVWTGGKAIYQDGVSCVAKYDPVGNSFDEVEVSDAPWLRGIAAGVEASEGYIWVAETTGTLYKIDQDSLAITDSYDFPSSEMVGVAIDFEGYVWTVGRDTNATYKFDPSEETFVTVPVGESPYTYSDMTGIQLQNAVPPL